MSLRYLWLLRLATRQGRERCRKQRKQLQQIDPHSSSSVVRLITAPAIAETPLCPSTRQNLACPANWTPEHHRQRPFAAFPSHDSNHPVAHKQSPHSATSPGSCHRSATKPATVS